MTAPSVLTPFMEETSPSITTHTTPEGSGVLLSGCWTAARLAEPVTWSRLQSALRDATTPAAATGTGEGTFQPFTDISGTQTGVPGYPVTQYQTAAEGLQAAHAALASHYASAATAGDFATATALQSTLAQHQALMPQNAAVPNYVPDTFSESDLYLAQNQ